MPKKSTLIIDGDNSGARRAITGTTDDLKKATNSTKAFSNQLKTAIGSYIGITAGLTLGVKIFNDFKNFDKGMRNVNTITRLGEQEFNFLKQQVLDLSSSLGEDAGGLTDALYQTVSAGVATKDAIKFLDIATRSAIAGVTDTKTSVDALTNVMNAWGLSINNITQISDAMFKTVEIGKTTYAELAAGISQVSSVAAASGISFQEILAAVATLTKGGADTSMAFTRIASAVFSMNKIFGDGWSKTMTLQEAMLKLAEKTGYSSTKLQELMGRKEGVLAVLTLASQKGKIAAEDLAKVGDSANATANAFNEQSKSVTKNIDLVVTAIENKLIKKIEDIATTITKLNETKIADDSALGWLIKIGSYGLFSLGKGGQIDEKYFKKHWEGFDQLQKKAKDATVETGNLFKQISEGKRFVPGEGWIQLAEQTKIVIDNTKKTIELSDEEKKKLEAQQKQWESLNKTLSLDIAKNTLPEISAKIFEIDQKFTEYAAKFPGHIAQINAWRDAMIQAAKDIPKIEIPDQLPFEAPNLDSLTKTQALLENFRLGYIAYSVDVSKLSDETTDKIASNYAKLGDNIDAELQKELAAQALREQAYSDTLGNMSDAFNTFSNLSAKQNKTLFAISKAFAIGQAVIATYEGAAKAIGMVELFPFNFVLAASIITAGLANVARIAATQPGQGASGGGSVSAPTSTGNSNTTNSNNRQANYTINFYGGGFDGDKDKLARELIDSLNKATDDGLILNVQRG